MSISLLVVLAASLLLTAGLIIIALRRWFWSLGTKGSRFTGPDQLFPMVIDELESFLLEKIDKLMAIVADIEAPEEQLQQLGFKLTEVSLYGNPLPDSPLTWNRAVRQKISIFRNCCAKNIKV